jgi:hypothetical protein
MPGRLTFLAFHPKALNDRSHLAGLLAFLLFREPSHPSADGQWYGVLSGKITSRYGEGRITATGIAPVLHRIPF